MKTLKSLVLASLAFGCASAAFSQTAVIRITGSTAFRSATNAALAHILNSGFTFAFIGSTYTGSNQAILSGTTINGNIPVIIKTNFTGSVGGVQTLTQNLTESSAWLVNGTQSSSSGVALVTASESFDTAITADVSMSDSFQGSTLFTTPELVDNVVGVTAFEFVRGNITVTTSSTSDIANLTNMTTLQAQNLLAGGLPLKQFTGNVADENIGVVVLGRDPDSGTRLCTFAETGFGIFNAPLQFMPSDTAAITGSQGLGDGSGATTTGTISSLVPAPARTVDGSSVALGQAGYFSGGNLAKDLGRPINATLNIGDGSNPVFLVGYLGTSDAATAIGEGGTALTYNGIAESANNVENGLYTFWSYEHLMYRSTFHTSNANGFAVANIIASDITNTDAAASGQIGLSSMTVGRQVEGGPVTDGRAF
jgi:hypothetical protein